MSQETDDDLIANLRKDIERWEGQEIEFMEDFPRNAHELTKEIAAFATSNPGTVYLGVNDDKCIVGVSNDGAHGEVKFKDSILNRLSGLTQKAIKPPIIVNTDFITIGGKIVVRIKVPKGVEPVYYSSDIPYIRNLTTSDRATPDQVKELHRIYFLERGTFAGVNATQNFLIDTIAQLSDFQILWSDHKNRIVNPDFNQMKYDIGATARRLSSLSRNAVAEEQELSDDLRRLGDELEEMEHHVFYIDGGRSLADFVKKGDSALELTNMLLQRVLKQYRPPKNQLGSIKKTIGENIKELKNCWHKRDRYLERGEISLLKDTFRRLAYAFNRLGILTPSEDFSLELMQAAKSLREISSDAYLATTVGPTPLIENRKKMEDILSVLENILINVSSSSPTPTMN